MDLKKVSYGDNVPEEVNVIIEISQGSTPVKYEFDKEKNLLYVNRFLPTAMYYPCNYGFIPNTCAGDGDPIDVLVLTRFPVMTGVLISVRPIGVLTMYDEAGEDVKIFSVPTKKVDIHYANICSYLDISKSFIDSITHFFSFYKKLEEGKFTSVGEWKDVKYAEKLILDSIIK
ncbi:inorganic diphosphatase [Candidatus Neoehrlichia procyonis]|uniref:Inorganic pyrophosphatase n=1 Tax=Candidatus Neoehrlichia procyonis str. RAC413 TaxID=1359163 RepID=A0A0F3NP15_9RICK|nr:inorganic diphosphatase [Candidatus Neoehrlichia lotoris]KJV69511.1 inorganic pyrophosphatase [Candidatus Neoehrlichia lotoris str. RAC413]